MGGALGRAIALSFLGLAFASLAACAPGSAGEAASPDAQRLLCPELGGNADPLEGTYSDAPAANARIRAFVASARGLNDVIVEIERRAFDACRRIAKDLGAPAAPMTAPLDVQCAPVRAAIATLVKEGIELRIAIAPPRCEQDGERKSRCAAAGGGAQTTSMCDLQATAYARCSLPAISFASSKNVDTAVRLGRALEESLPAMIYADMALGRRLVTHVEELVAASVKLPNELKDAGAHGLACVGFASSVTVKAAERLRAFLALSAAIVLDLDPEITPATRGPS